MVAVPASGAPAPSRVKVWDPVVRLFHWTLAFGCIANLTVLREAHGPHRVVGYVVLVALAIRVAWGVVGPGHARFRAFVPTPTRLGGYVRALLKRAEPRYLGHNPAGAIMMLALMALAAFCGVTGWMMGLDAFWGERWLEGLHETAANMILIMAGLHVVAAVIESWRHRENLVAAMVTGWKRPAQGTDVDHASSARRG
ncbi:MAG: cytochrome b/b6 domain-containing protein [Caulobacteraceae bacterium]|nr:cytochrome b/b6 domain-containing protein [Caulobacteraceae bacterium]